jgi:hypothetical protein
LNHQWESDYYWDLSLALSCIILEAMSCHSSLYVNNLYQMLIYIAAFYFCLYPLIAYTLAQINNNELEMGAKASTYSEKSEDIRINDLFRIPRFVFSLISQFAVYGAVTFIYPIMALHLEQFGFHTMFIGFSFAIPTLIYASTAPLIFLLTERYKKSAVIFMGYLLMCVSLFFIGPSKLLEFYNSSGYILLGLSIMGFGAGMITIPIMSEMIESVEERHSEFDEA